MIWRGERAPCQTKVGRTPKGLLSVRSNKSEGKVQKTKTQRVIVLLFILAIWITNSWRNAKDL